MFTSVFILLINWNKNHYKTPLENLEGIRGKLLFRGLTS